MRNNIHDVQRQVVQHVPPLYRSRRRIPRVNLNQPFLHNGDLVQRDASEDGVDAVDVEHVMEDYWVFWLRAMVFASQKLKIEELEAKVKNHDALQVRYDDLLADHETLAQTVVSYRDENEGLRAKLCTAELERDAAVNRLKISENMKVQMQRGYDDTVGQLNGKDAVISGLRKNIREALEKKEDLVAYQEKIRIDQQHSILLALGSDSLDAVSAAKNLKRKADKRKEKLRKAREQIEKLTIEKDSLSVKKDSLEVDIEQLKMDLENASGEQRKSEELKTEAEMALHQAKRMLQEKESCIESKEATCQNLTVALDELQKDVEQKTADLEQANVDFKFAVEKFCSLDGDYKKRVEEVEWLRAQMARIQNDKVEAGLALGLEKKDTEVLQFGDLVETIKSQEALLEEALMGKKELEQLSGVLISKLEAVAQKLGAKSEDVLTDRIDELLEELRAEQGSNQQARTCLSTSIKQSKDIREAAMYLDDAHTALCKERDQLVSNQTLLIEKLRTANADLELVMVEYHWNLLHQQIGQCTEYAVLNERAKNYKLELAMMNTRVDSQILFEGQVKTIEVLSGKKKELEEKVVQILAELQESKDVSKDALARLRSVEERFEKRGKEHMELTKMLESIQSEHNAAKSSLEQREQVITILKSEIQSLVESKTRFINLIAGVFGLDLSEDDASLKLIRIRDNQSQAIGNLHKNLVEASEAVETLKAKLAEEADKLRLEMEDRSNDNAVYQVNLALYAFSMANLSQYIDLLERNNNGLDLNIRNRIKTIKMLQEELDKANQKRGDLSAELDEMFYKYLDAETNYELAMEALLKSQNDYRDLMGALRIADEKVSDLYSLRGSLIKERDDAVQQGIHKDQLHLDLTTRISQIGKKLQLKISELASERSGAATISQTYEQVISELHQKARDELVEKKRLAKELLDEKLARQYCYIDVQALKEQITRLEDQKRRLEDEDKLEDEKTKPVKRSVATPALLYRYQSCDDCECDSLVTPRPAEGCSSAEITALVESRAKTLAKIDLEQCKNIKVANLALFSSGLASLGAAGGLVGYWVIKLKPLIGIAVAAA